LISHGYTFAAKGTPECFSPVLYHEAEIYNHLRSIEGRHVPIHLGNIKLKKGYLFEVIAEITHIMLLGFADSPVKSSNGHLKREVTRSLQTVHDMGMLPRDVVARNILTDGKQVLIIDFDRARILDALRQS